METQEHITENKTIKEQCNKCKEYVELKEIVFTKNGTECLKCLNHE